ncbi:MAG: hypothetical protein RBS20_03980, partial [Atribacterota bacterium]|nr:hypothetical protein [Atribacterota bacterium]
LLILIILVAVICATAFIFKQNKEYTKLNQEYIVKEKSVETIEEEVRAETDLPVLDEDRTVTGNGDIEFRSGSDIIIF